MHVQYLPQSILNKLPIELWQVIEQINKNEWIMKKKKLENSLFFINKYEIIESYKRRVFFQKIQIRELQIEHFFNYKNYSLDTLAEIIRIENGIKIKMVVIFNKSYFCDIYKEKDAYFGFLRYKNFCKIIIFTRNKIYNFK